MVDLLVALEFVLVVWMGVSVFIIGRAFTYRSSMLMLRFMLDLYQDSSMWYLSGPAMMKVTRTLIPRDKTVW